MQKYRLGNAEIFTGKSRARNGNTAVRIELRREEIRNKQEEVRNQML